MRSRSRAAAAPVVYVFFHNVEIHPPFARGCNCGVEVLGGGVRGIHTSKARVQPGCGADPHSAAAPEQRLHKMKKGRRGMYF